LLDPILRGTPLQTNGVRRRELVRRRGHVLREGDRREMYDAPLEGPRAVLLVVPDSDLRRPLERILRRHWRVQVVEDSGAVCPVARRMRPTVVLAALGTPGTGALELARAVRGERELLGLPLIMTWGKTDPASRAAALEAGADDILPEPFSPLTLVALLHHLISEPRRRGAGDAAAPPAAHEGLEDLLVDPSIDAREALATALRAGGDRVRLVASAAAALELYDASPPDVVVSDVPIAERDGYELVRALRARERTSRRTVAIALTALSSRADRQNALYAGFDEHIAKPAAPRLVAERLRTLVHAHAAVARARARGWATSICRSPLRPACSRARATPFPARRRSPVFVQAVPSPASHAFL
jgi:DNA-binding response OmpR family regulator